MEIKKDLVYTASHEWVKFLEDTTVEIGLTDFAQNSLGDLVFVELPEVGDKLALEDSFANVESVKSVSEVYSPVSGVVTEVNEALLDAPEAINEDPYGAWLVRVGNITEKAELLTPEAYEKVVEEEE